MAWFFQKYALSESTNESEKCMQHLVVLEKSQSSGIWYVKNSNKVYSDNNDRWLWQMESTYFYFPNQFFLYIDSLKLPICAKVFVGWRLLNTTLLANET